MSIRSQRKAMEEMRIAFDEFTASARDTDASWTVPLDLPKPAAYSVLHYKTPAGQDNYLVASSDDSKPSELLGPNFDANFVRLA